MAMRSLRRIVDDFHDAPPLLRFGVSVLVIGGALDVVYHAVPDPWQPALALYLGADGYLAHLVTSTGMLLTVLGLTSSAALASRRRAAPAPPKRSSAADRGPATWLRRPARGRRARPVHKGSRLQ